MESNTERFIDLVAPGSGAIDGHLDVGALLIAASIDPRVAVEEELTRLDRLADESAAGSLEELLCFLFGAARFRGDRSDYYNPQNSFLNRVLDRRLGIPITLAIVTIEVGRRRGMAIDGVGMPGHFLAHSAGTFVDVFAGGVLLDEGGCENLATQLGGRPVTLPAGSLDPTPPADILRRMCLNLRMISERTNDAKLFRNSLTLLTSFPEVGATDLVLLASAHAAAGQFDRAAAVGDRAVQLMPVERREDLETQVQGWRARLN